jgi:hypothetical protein
VREDKEILGWIKGCVKFSSVPAIVEKVRVKKTDDKSSLFLENFYSFRAIESKYLDVDS